jgi:hypothetical protein
MPGPKPPEGVLTTDERIEAVADLTPTRRGTLLPTLLGIGPNVTGCQDWSWGAINGPVGST